jgi:translation initiation factor 3 subunit M
MHSDAKAGAAAYHCQVRYVSTFTSADATSDEARDAARTAAVETIARAEVFQCDHLLALPAVQALRTSDAPLAALLEIVAQQPLAAFDAWYAAHPQALASLGLSYDAALEKMRLLSLTSLAAEQSEIPYARVAASLRIDENDVERWVVVAIGAQLIGARLDQQARVVRVSHHTQRVFTNAQWEQLRTQLSAWSANLRAVLPVLHAGVPLAGGAAALPSV